MHERGQARLGITIPKRAPAVEVKRVGPPSPIAILPTWCITHPALQGRALQVLFAYCAHADKSGITRCSQERIAVILGISRQLVSRHVKRMKAAGIMRDYRNRHVGNGRMLKLLQIVFDPNANLSAEDARSIASPTQHHTVAKVNGNHGRLSTGPTDLRNIMGSVGAGATLSALAQHPGSSGDLRNSQEVAQTTLKPKSIPLQLQTAEAVIAHWSVCAWMHGDRRPVANEDDLATATALAEKGITSGDLEDCVHLDPTSPRLAPLVRHLLS